MVFEWMAGEQFLIERWEVPVPEAPDGLAIIGFDDRPGHTSCSTTSTRAASPASTAMSLEDGVWTLRREAPDFSPLDFAQRFTGTFSDDGTTIVGRWEIAHDRLDLGARLRPDLRAGPAEAFWALARTFRFDGLVARVTEVERGSSEEIFVHRSIGDQHAVAGLPGAR